MVNSLQFIVHGFNKIRSSTARPAKHWRSGVNRPLPGLTLVELVAGFGIIGLIGVFVAAIYIAHFKLFSNQNTAIEVSTQNKLALDEMTNEIRESQGIVTSCCSPTETTSASELVMRIWPVSSSGDPIDPGSNNTYDYIIYKRDTDPTKLIKKVVPDATSSRQASTKIIGTSLGTNSSDFQLTYDNGDVTAAHIVTISLTTTATSFGKTQTITQTGKALLRNK